jgi:hypothetical protein
MRQLAELEGIAEAELRACTDTSHCVTVYFLSLIVYSLHSILQCAQHYKLYYINLWRECVRMVYKMCIVHGKGDGQWSLLAATMMTTTMVSGHRQLRQVAGAVGRFTGGRGIAKFLSSKKNSECTRICRVSCDYTFFCGNTTIFHLYSIRIMI